MAASDVFLELGDRLEVPSMRGLGITQIVVDYQFTLRFGSHQLVIGEPFEVRSDGSAPLHATPETREGIGQLLDLFGQVVARVAAFKDGSLTLDFADGRSLFVPAGGKYEAWTLGAGGHAFIVSKPGGELSVWS